MTAVVNGASPGGGVPPSASGTEQGRPEIGLGRADTITGGRVDDRDGSEEDGTSIKEVSDRQ
jgi:hypothetical protein